MPNKFSLGIDVGSTTVKTVITDIDGNIIYSKYQRHFSKVKETVTDQLKIIQADYPGEEFAVPDLVLQILRRFLLSRKYMRLFWL